MLEEVTQKELRAQMEEHLLMVEEVIGGLDHFIQRLEKRITKIEDGLGIDQEGEAAPRWIAEIKELKDDFAIFKAASNIRT